MTMLGDARGIIASATLSNRSLSLQPSATDVFFYRARVLRLVGVLALAGSALLLAAPELQADCSAIGSNPVTINVKKGGSGCTTITAAVALITSPLTDDYQILIDSQTYSEQVTIQGKDTATHNKTITIKSDPIMVATATVVNPPASSIAAFRVLNASVTIAGIDIVSTNSVSYGVLVSSAYATISNVNVQDAAGHISVAGIAVSSNWASISYSSVTANNAYGLYLTGANYNSVSHSTMTSLNAGLYLTGASSNTVSESYMNGSGGSGYGAYLRSNSNANSISQSTMTGLYSGLDLVGASSNSVTESYIYSANQYGLRLESGSNSNSISRSTMTGYSYGLYLPQSSSNSVTGSYMSSANGNGATLSGSNSNTISQNTMTGHNAGLYLTNSSSSNLVTGNYMYGANQYGANISYSNYNSINQSTMTSVLYYGLQLIGASSNSITGSYLYGTNEGADLVSGSNSNSISQSTMTGNFNGLFLDSSSSNSVTGSSMYGSHGAHLEFGCNSNKINQSTMTGRAVGLYLFQSSSNTAAGCYIQGSTAAFIFGSTSTIIAYSTLVSTWTGGIGLQMSNGSVNLTLSSSTVLGGVGGAAVFLDRGNTGVITLSSDTITSTATVGSPYYGLLIATQGASGVFTRLSITSMTFMDPLPAGTTAIDFLGGTFLSTFTSVGFYSSNIGANINASPLAVNSTIWMLLSAGAKAGPSDADDPKHIVNWPFFNPPPGCGAGYNVGQNGFWDFSSIKIAVNALSGTTLSTTTCIVVRDTQTYSEQVTVQRITNNGYRLQIISDPSFISSAPAINPPTKSTAAFQIANASVTITGINIISTNTVQWGVLASSPLITITDVNVQDAAGKIWGAGMSLGSYNTVNYSSVTVAVSSYAFYLNGSSMTVVSYSSAQANSSCSSCAALYLANASSNTFTVFLASNPAGSGITLSTGSNSNTISQSVITGKNFGLYLQRNSSNSAAGCYIQGSTAVFISGSTGTVIAYSTLISPWTGGIGLQLSGGSVNLTLSSSTIQGGVGGEAVFLDQGNTGAINLSSDTITSTATVGSPYYGLLIATQGAGGVFTGLSIASMTFTDPLPAGTTAIDFLGGTFRSTFTAVAFNSTNIGANINTRPLAVNSTTWMIFSAGPRTGRAYSDDPNHVAHWTFINPLPGCDAGCNVGQDGSWDYTSIQPAVSALSGTTLSATTCIVVRDTQTYCEAVTVQNIVNNGYRFIIMSDPSFISSAPAVNPPTKSTAAFQVMNASVTITGINIISTNTMQWGVLASSPLVTITDVNVQDAAGKIWGAGMSLGSYDTVNYSSVTVANAYGFYLNGSSMTAVSYSSAQADNSNYGALYLIGASSNTIANSFMANSSADGATLDTGSNSNTISRSTMTSLYYALHLSGASSNSIIASCMYGTNGTGAILEPGSNSNIISQSTVTGKNFGLYLTGASSNSVSGSYMYGSGGYGAELLNGSNSNSISLSAMAGLYGLKLQGTSANTAAGCYVQGSTAVWISNSIDTIIAYSTLVSTWTGGIGLQMSQGSVNLTISSSTVKGGISGAAVFLDRGNSGSITLSSNTITSTATAGSPYYGLLIAAQGAGGVFTGLSITSMTFADPLPAGTTAIDFLGGTFLSTFAAVAFNSTNIGTNINVSPLTLNSTVWMLLSAGPRTGRAYADDPDHVAHWTLIDPPLGCGAGYNVAQDGSWDYASIQQAVNAINGMTLGANTCVVVRDTQTYCEAVTVQNINNNGYQLQIMSDPSFVSSAPVVNPPAGSTAAFQIMNAGVTLINLTVISTNSVQYGVLASSPLITITSINVQDAAGKIWGAGMSLGSYDTVSYSSVTVANAYGFYLSGASMTAVSYSSAQADNLNYGALYLTGASSNTIASSFLSNSSGDGATLDTGSNSNTISQSAVTGKNFGLYLQRNSSNSAAGCYIQGSTAVFISGSTGTVIAYSTLMSPWPGGIGLQLSGGSVNLTLSSSTVQGGIGGEAMFLDRGNTGSIVLCANTITSTATVGLPYYGLLIAPQGAGGAFTSLSIASMTFTDPLPAGTTAIDFLGGTFLSTFTSLGFNSANLGTNINAGALNTDASIYLVAPTGIRTGRRYSDDPFFYVHWPVILPPGCGAGFNVGQNGDWEHTSINAAVKALNGTTLSTATCIVVRDTQTYSEQVTVQGITNNGYRLQIMADPSFISSAPAVNPPANIATAAFQILNASVTIANIAVITTNTVSYGIVASSVDVVLSSVSVQDSNGNITVAGIAISASRALISYSSVTVQSAYGLYLDKASSNTAAGCYIQGSTAVLVSGSTGTVITYSTLVSTWARGIGLQMGGGSVNLALSSSSIKGGIGGAAVVLDQGNTGSIDLSSDTITGPVGSPYYGLLIATQGASGAAFQGLSITSMTFFDMASGAIGISFGGGRLLATFSYVDFAAPGIIYNVDASALDPSANITMFESSGPRKGAVHANDPSNVISWVYSYERPPNSPVASDIEISSFIVSYGLVGADGYELKASTALNLSGTVFVSSTSNPAMDHLALQDLRANTTYFVKAGALWSGTTIYASAFPVVTLALPPTGSVLTGMARGSAMLSWSANGNPDGTIYDVLSWTTGGSTITFSTQSVNATISNLPSGTTVYCAVQALNNASPPVPTALDITLSTYIPPPPLAPTLSAVALGVSSITWTWTLSTGAVEYQLLTSTGGAVSGVLSPTSSSFTETGLSTNTAMTRTVQAFNITGSSDSALISRFTLASPPDSFALLGSNGNSASVSWSGFNPTGTTYALQWWTAGGSTVTISTQSTGYLSYGALSNLTGSTTVYLTIKALNGDGISTAYYDVVLSTFILGAIAVAIPPGGGSAFFQTSYGYVNVIAPPQAFPSGATLTIQYPTSIVPAATGNLQELTTPFDFMITAADTLGNPLQPALPLTIISGYSGATLGVNESNLVIARFDTIHDAWVPLLTARDSAGKTLTAQTDHLSLFQILGTGATAGDLSQVTVGPIPLRPSLTPGGVMTFRYLPAGARLRIHTVLGTLVADFNADASGLAAWDGRNMAGRPAASGVYFVFMTNGGQNKTIRVVIQR